MTKNVDKKCNRWKRTNDAIDVPNSAIMYDMNWMLTRMPLTVRMRWIVRRFHHVSVWICRCSIDNFWRRYLCSNSIRISPRRESSMPCPDPALVVYPTIDIYRIPHSPWFSKCFETFRGTPFSIGPHSYCWTSGFRWNASGTICGEVRKRIFLVNSAIKFDSIPIPKKKKSNSMLTR